MKSVLTSQKVESLWSAFRETYPGITSLSDPRFVSEEIAYKRQAAKEATSLLGASQMRHLLGSEEYQQLTQRVRKICQKTNLLYLATPLSSDCSILFEREDRRSGFWQKLYELLHGEQPLLDRFDAYLKFVELAKLPNKWTFPTYLLFLLHPTQAIFVKPRRMAQSLQMVDPDFVLESKPSAAQYRHILDVASSLLESFSARGAQDFIDVQSLIWVCTSSFNRRAETSKELYELLDQYKAEYLNTETGRSHLDHYQQAQKQAVESWEKLKAGRLAGNLQSRDVFRWTLPHKKTSQIQETDLWTHPSSFAAGPVIDLLVARGVVSGDELPGKAEALFNFYNTVLNDPDQLAEAAEDFEKSPDSKGLRSGTLSPWLNALAPASFLVINKKSRMVISYFSGIELDESLRSFVCGNQEGLRLIDEHPELAKIAPGHHPSFVFDAFCHWLVAIKKHLDHTRWWFLRIFPGEPAQTADRCDQLFGEDKPNVIGWESTQSDEANRPYQQWFEEEIEIGDRIIVMEDRRLVHAVVEVTGEPETGMASVPWFKSLRRVTLAHRFTPPLKTRSQAPVATLTQAKRSGQISSIVDQVERAIPRPQPKEALFGRRAFELLSYLKKTPTRDCYQKYREDFRTCIEDPLKELFEELAKSLNDQITSHLETTRGLFSKILKNDFGQGGAWPHLWAAFYPTGGKRIADAQLYFTITAEGVRAGFHIGAYGKEPLDRLRRHLSQLTPQLEEQIAERLAGTDLQYGGVTEAEASHTDFQSWKSAVGDFFPRIFQSFPAEEAAKITLAEWKMKLQDLYEKLWPIFLLSTSDNPWPLVDGEVDFPSPQPPYNLADFEKETGIEAPRVQDWLKILDRKKHIILQGPPGTGKTYVAQRLARLKVSETSGLLETVQFHPSYSYEDFMEGLRPCESTQGFTYKLFPGRFLEFCDRATAAGGDPCVLILDELNRAPLSRVFGELMYALEYRDCPIRLAYSGHSFKIPENVYLIATMNTADRSIALVDHALRRRFSFISLKVDYDVLRKHLLAQGVVNAAGFVEVLKRINGAIDDENFSVGISYFMKPGVELKHHIAAIWQGEIEPYLDELLYGQTKQIKYKWSDLADEMTEFL
jgi:5-methylcytosine-specific restriction enzyme B